MSNLPLFTPLGTVTRAVTSGASGSVALPTVHAGMPRTVRIFNPLAEIVWVEFGNASVVATVPTSCPLGPNSIELFDIGGATTHVAFIGTAGGGSVFATVGQGT